MSYWTIQLIEINYDNLKCFAIGKGIYTKIEMKI